MRILVLVVLALILPFSLAAQTQDAFIVPPVPQILVPQDVPYPADPTKFDAQFWLPPVWEKMIERAGIPFHIPKTISIEACNFVEGLAYNGDTLCIGNYYPGPGHLQDMEQYRLWTHILYHMLYPSFVAPAFVEGLDEGTCHDVYLSLGFTGDTDLYTADVFNNLPANAVAGLFFTQQFVNRYHAAAGPMEAVGNVLGGFEKINAILQTFKPDPNNDGKFLAALDQLPNTIDGQKIGTYLSKTVVALATATPGPYLAVYASAPLFNGDRQKTPVNPWEFDFDYLVQPALSKPPGSPTYPAAVIKYWLEDDLGKALFISTLSTSASIYRPYNGVAAPPLNYPYSGRYTVKACISPDGGKTCSTDPHLSASFDYLIWPANDWANNKMFVLYHGNGTLVSVNDPSISVAMSNGVAVVTGGEGKNITLTDGTNTYTFTWVATTNHLSLIKIWPKDKLSQPVVSAIINSFRTDGQEIADTINGVRPTAVAAGSYISLLGWGFSPDDPVTSLGCTPLGCKNLPPAYQGNLGHVEVRISGTDSQGQPISWPLGLLNVSWNQMDVQISDYWPAGPAIITAYLNGVPANSWPIQVVRNAPGLAINSQRAVGAMKMVWSDADQQWYFFPIDQTNPAYPGDTIVLFTTGMGPFWPGDYLTSHPWFMDPVTVTVDGAPVQLIWAEPQNHWVGLDNVYITLPQLPPGAYPLVVTVGGQDSNTGLLSIAAPNPN